MKTTIKVTQADIDQADRELKNTTTPLCERCPVAIALTKATGVKCQVSGKMIDIGSPYGPIFPRSVALEQFVINYDNPATKRLAVPFEFELDI